MLKLIFIDVDGVLNNEENIVYLYETTPKEDREKIILERGFGRHPAFSKRNLNNLKYIINSTDAYLVLSSTWRLSQAGINSFIKAIESIGIERKRYLGHTPSLYHNPNWGRGREIYTWLEKNNYKKNPYVIIDDDSDMNFKNCMEHFVKVNGTYGLSIVDRQKAISILKDIVN